MTVETFCQRIRRGLLTVASSMSVTLFAGAISTNYAALSRPIAGAARGKGGRDTTAPEQAPVARIRAM